MQHSLSLPDPERTSDRLLQRLGVEGIPIDVHSVTNVWSNLSIREEHIDGAGYLLPLGKLGAEIIVRQADPVERRRFTIAHEVGHWVLGITCEHRTGEFRQPGGVGNHTLVEKWCDTFAAAFLIPRNALIEYFCNVSDEVLISHLLNAPKRFRVSEEAMFLRAYEVLGMRIVYVALEPSSVRILQPFVPKEVVPEIEKLLASQEVQEILRVDMFTSRVRVGTSQFVFAWSKLPHSYKNVLVLNPCGVVNKEGPYHGATDLLP